MQEVQIRASRETDNVRKEYRAIKKSLQMLSFAKTLAASYEHPEISFLKAAVHKSAEQCRRTMFPLPS